MKVTIANSIRADVLARILPALVGEDVGQIASNAVNFPVVGSDGSEAWVEVTVKVTKDGGDDGYLKRDEYLAKVAEAAERKAKADKAKAEREAAKASKAK